MAVHRDVRSGEVFFETLLELSRDGDHGRAVQRIAAATQQASVLSQLSTHPERRVRYTVADNPNAPADVLDALAADGDERVGSNALRNLESRRSARLRHGVGTHVRTGTGRTAHRKVFGA